MFVGVVRLVGCFDWGVCFVCLGGGRDNRAQFAMNHKSPEPGLNLSGS